MTRKPLAFLAARDAARVLSLYLCIEPQRWWFGAPLVRPLSRVSRRRIRHRPDLRAHVECYWMPVWRSRRGMAWAMAWGPSLSTAGSPLSSSRIGFAILVLVQRVLAFSPSLLPPSSPPVSCPSDAHRSSLDSGLHPPPRSQLTGPLSTRTRDSRPHRSQDPPAPYHARPTARTQLLPLLPPPPLTAHAHGHPFRPFSRRHSKLISSWACACRLLAAGRI